MTTLMREARQGNTAALKGLTEAFRTLSDADDKEALASFLEDRLPNDPSYHAYLISLVEEVLKLDPPYPMAYQDRPTERVSAQFEKWCRVHHLSLEKGVDLVARYPSRLNYCTNVPSEIALLLKALELQNPTISSGAAERLSDLKITNALARIETRGAATPLPYRLSFAKSIGRFNTEEAWQAVDRLLPEPELRKYIRERILKP